MALRLIELFIPEDKYDDVVALLKAEEEHKFHGMWHEKLEDDQALVKLLLHAEDTEYIMDILEKRFSHLETFRMILLAAEATVPRLEEPKKEPEEKVEEKEKTPRISREELYTKVTETTEYTNVYVVMVVLSSIVAAVGILHDNVAVIIGAMVIAPLLGPNVAFSLATTLGDTSLARKGLKANSVGISTALVCATVLGTILTVDPTTPELASRTVVGLGDVALALASGSAGALAFTTGVSATLIGVMVAVALLPPVVSLGMLMGAGHLDLAFGALLLLLTNIICVNLAGVVTFLAQGIRPITWWEKDKAKRATRRAIIIWAVLLTILIGVILVSQQS